jgi:hypothetical protein
MILVATLLFKYRPRVLSAATENIGEVKRSYKDALQRLGFTDVVHSSSEVAGNKNGCRVAILHLHIAGPNFHEVFMVGGDNADASRNVLEEAVAIRFHFL